MSKFTVQVANSIHESYAEEICKQIAESAQQRGTGIAKRTPEYIINKMNEGKAIIATADNGDFAGFCYIETWGHGKYAANSGLIVNPKYRKNGLARKIKEKAFKYSRQKFPDAKLFGLTTSLAVMKLNSDLGYHPVTFSELTDDDEFWKGCSSCVNYEILQSKNRQNCLCTGLLYDPKTKKKKKWDFIKKSRIYGRMVKIKEAVFKPTVRIL